MSAIRQREAEKLAAERELSALERTTKAAAWDPATIERDLRARLIEWRELLRRQIPQARQVLKKLLAAPLKFTPCRDGDSRYYEFTAQIAVGRVFNGIAVASMVASPRGSEPVFWH